MKTILEYINYNKILKPSLNKEDLQDIFDDLSINDEEQSPFKKKTTILEYDLNEFSKQYKIENWIPSEPETLGYVEAQNFKLFLKKVKNNTINDKLIVIDGSGYDGKCIIIVFFSTKPYKYIIHYVDGVTNHNSKIYSHDDKDDVIITILRFCTD